MGCKKETEEVALVIDIDCIDSKIEGSFVQNTLLNSTNKFRVFFDTSFSGKIAFSAKEVNGVYIPDTLVIIENSNSAEISILGKPLDLGEFALKIKAVTHNKEMFCSQIFEVTEDTDPTAPILFNLEEDNILGLTNERDINFTIDPPGASIIAKSGITGLVVSSEIDKRTGQGVLKLAAGDNFISGELVLSITYGVREEVTKRIKVNAFESGEGTTESPYEINSASLLKKIRFGLDRAYLVTADIDLEMNNWTPAGSLANPFIGTLDGGNKLIQNVQILGTDNIAFIGYTSTGAVLKNIKLSGSAEGETFVAGLVAHNNGGIIENCDASNFLITGTNNLSGLVANNIGGTISNSVPDASQVLVLSNFPSLISGLGTVVRQLEVTPPTAVVTITTIPDLITASIDNRELVITGEEGFEKGELAINVNLGKVNANPTINLFAEEQFDDGSGEASDPYLISSALQFNKMRDFPSAFFKLMDDIDMSEIENWVPISTFDGEFNGNGKSINNLILTDHTIKGGLFVENSGTIKNLRVIDVDVTTTAEFGLIVGDNSGTIENVIATGSILSTHSGDLLGGIAAEMTSGKITKCYTNLEITSSCGMTAGILGRAKSGASEVSNCTVEGVINVNGSKSRIAGIVARGESAVIIKNCLSSVSIYGLVPGVNGVGGIFGADNGAAIRIEECMFNGTISAASNVGGIAGVGPNIINCLVEGLGANNAVSTLLSTEAPNPGSVGGVSGINKTQLHNCIARELTIRGVSSATAKIAGISSGYQNNGYTNGSVVLNTSIEGSLVQQVSGSLPTAPSILSNNYAVNVDVIQSSEPFVPVNDKDGLDGELISESALNQAFYTSLGFDFATIWKWNNDKPYLQNVGYNGSLLIP